MGRSNLICLMKKIKNIHQSKLELECEEGNLKEEAFYKENEQQWKAEQIQQEYDYENIKL